MIDLTPLDVRKKRGDFRRILRGYDPEEVDTFMDLVAERFEELVRENLILREQTESLADQVESLVGREKAVQEALVSAQKLREDVKDQSQKDADLTKGQAVREAELVKAEADAEIGRRLGEAEGLIRERQRALEELERSRLKFLKSFRGLLEREMDAVEVEESRRPLEETPLEFEFRGWQPSDGFEPEVEVERDAEEEEDEWPAVATVADLAEGEADGELGVEPEEEDHPEDEMELDAEYEPEAEAEYDPEVEVESDVQVEPEQKVEAEWDGSPAEETPMDNEGEWVEAEAEADSWAAIVPAEGAIQVVEAVEAGLSDEEPFSDEAEAEIDETDVEGEEGLVPGGFETQVLEGAAPVGIEDLAPAVEEDEGGIPADDLQGNDGGPEEATSDTSSSEVPEEPKWLFSLLKKEEEERGVGG